MYIGRLEISHALQKLIHFKIDPLAFFSRFFFFLSFLGHDLIAYTSSLCPTESTERFKVQELPFLQKLGFFARVVWQVFNFDRKR